MKKLQRKIAKMQRVDQNILEATKTQRNIAKMQRGSQKQKESD